jgi:hypothetical protein
MTSKEAMVFMARGGKVRYKTWWWGRYLAMDKAQLLTESGNTFPRKEFDLETSNDWEEYDEIKHGTQNEKKTEAGN